MMTMMMLGEPTRSNPTVQIPPTWDPLDESTAGINLNLNSPYSVNSSGSYGNAGEYCNSPGSVSETLAALHRFLPSNETEVAGFEDECDFALVDAFSCDQFRMYEFKVRKCARGRSHDWTECPYAHPGEKARRRDPRKFHYSGNACPDFRKGVCKKGDSCEFAHGVFECWLHPDRYRTQPCKDGLNCRRRVCFFAHSPEQLRHVSPQQSPRSANSADFDFPTSPTRPTFDSYLTKYAASYTSSPASMFTNSPPSDSPPMSPQHGGGSGSGSMGIGSPSSIGDLVASMRKMKLSPRMMKQQQQFGSGYGSISPRSSVLRPGSYSVPITPTRVGFGGLDSVWEGGCEEEPAMERVESGRDLRARIYAKLSKENSLDRPGNPGSGPDVGWVSELVK